MYNRYLTLNLCFPPVRYKTFCPFRGEKIHWRSVKSQREPNERDPSMILVVCVSSEKFLGSETFVSLDPFLGVEQVNISYNEVRS